MGNYEDQQLTYDDYADGEMNIPNPMLFPRYLTLDQSKTDAFERSRQSANNSTTM